MALIASRHRRAVHLVRRLPVPAAAAAAVVAHHPERVVGQGLAAPWAASAAPARISVDLPGGRQLARRVDVRFGPMMEDRGVSALPVWWEDSEHPHLFPTFDGALELIGGPEGTGLRLIGSYEPPLGAVGRFADGMVGHRVVMASLEGFLDEVAARLTDAVSGPAGGQVRSCST